MNMNSFLCTFPPRVRILVEAAGNHVLCTVSPAVKLASHQFPGLCLVLVRVHWEAAETDSVAHSLGSGAHYGTAPPV